MGSQEPFFIVGIGASAGGLESLENLFHNMPDDTGMAFVVIQHLSPDFRSMMDELLARHTRMEIHQAKDGMKVEPNCVYLLPPKKEMVVSDGKLYLTDKDPKQGLTLPIDHFFRSLAQDCGDHAIGIILSGTGSDGSRGIRDIARAGGLVICESEGTAKFDGMPLSAQETGVVDLILAPEEMGKALVAHAADPKSHKGPKKDPLRTESQTRGVQAIFELLKDEYDIDFSYYKETTVSRRIERRLSLSHTTDLDEYVKWLRSDPQELNSLYKDLLIGVTRFFRDADVFERLQTTIIPRLIEQKKANEDIRVWIAGCATGEEAYSLAILLHEALEKAEQPFDVKIFATDIHKASLDHASRGVYDEDRLKDVSPERLKRYFSKRSDGYHVSQDIREQIVFAPHNVLKDAPFTHLDLISCRNMLIYLQPAAQKKALSLFHFGLKTGGILFLGSSETPGDLSNEFATLDEHCKLYRKRRDIRLPADMRLPLAPAVQHGRPTLNVKIPAPVTRYPDIALLSTYDQLLDRYMPPSLLINENRELVECFGGAESLLRIKGRRLSTDIFDLLDPEMKSAVAGALQRCIKENGPVLFSGVRLRTGSNEQSYKVSVDPLHSTRTNITHYLIALEPLGQAHLFTEQASNQTTAQPDAAEMSRDHLIHLEEELRYTKENLQATVEELETSNEELQATNEELVASNEELQSTNEELHSVNEELYTVNAEYQKKIEELAELNRDMNHLLASTDVAILYLDRNLCIRKFTPQMAEIFDLMEQDIGRRISSFTHKIQYDGLIDVMHRILDKHERIETEVRSADGTCHFLRILPYQINEQVDGVVLSLIDITALDEARQRLTQLSAIVESSHDAIIGTTLEGNIASWNGGAEHLYGYAADDAIGQSIMLIVPAERREELRQLQERIRRGEQLEPLKTVRRHKDGHDIEVLLTLSPIKDAFGNLVGFSGIARDISELQVALRQLQERDEQIHLLLESTAEAIYGVDTEGICTFCNPACVKTLGYQSSADLIGRNMHDLSHHTRSDGTPYAADGCPLSQAYKVGNAVHSNNDVLWRADGSSFPAEIWSYPMRKGDRVIGAVVTFLDITDRRRAEEAMRQQVKEREDFLAILSHELRNPLHAVRTASEVLALCGGPDDMDATSRQVIARQTAHMTRLLDDLLDLSRIARNRFELRSRTTDLGQTTRAALEAIEPFATEHGVEIVQEIGDEPIWVFGDPARLQQVQVNLLSNAVKHSPAGEAVTISVGCVGAMSFIRVKDNGIGLAPDMVERIFEPFFQSAEILDERDRGMGLGLTLVRTIVQMHGGDITVQSAGLGNGSEFVVRLPACSHSAEPEKGEKPPLPNVCRKIVIVEDQEDSRNILLELLKLKGFEVSAAANGPQGIEMIVREKPDLALVDIGLPLLNGYEVALEVRRRLGSNVHLVALTGFGQPNDVEKALAAGFNDHLVKPFNLDAFEQILRKKVMA